MNWRKLARFAFSVQPAKAGRKKRLRLITKINIQIMIAKTISVLGEAIVVCASSETVSKVSIVAAISGVDGSIGFSRDCVPARINKTSPVGPPMKAATSSQRMPFRKANRASRPARVKMAVVEMGRLR